MYSPAKHHWGVVMWERRVGGWPPVLFKTGSGGRGGGGGGGGVWGGRGRQRGRGESLTSCSPPSHKRSAEPQRRAGRSRKQTAKLINGRGEGGAGMAFRLRLHGVSFGVGGVGVWRRWRGGS